MLYFSIKYRVVSFSRSTKFYLNIVIDGTIFFASGRHLPEQLRNHCYIFHYKPNYVIHMKVLQYALLLRK